MTAQEDFEAEREQVLDDLPDSIKDMFGMIGFCQVEANDDSDDDEERQGHGGGGIRPVPDCVAVRCATPAGP
jgi:hypothetical protein